jgi:hypothetical protein
MNTKSAEQRCQQTSRMYNKKTSMNIKNAQQVGAKNL